MFKPNWPIAGTRWANVTITRDVRTSCKSGHWPTVIRHSLVLLSAALFTLAWSQACAGDEPPLARYEFREPHMGTEFKIILYTADEPTATAAARAAFARIAELDAMLSDYRPDSELMQLCAKAGGPPVQVSDELYVVLSHAQDLSKRSDSAFDVTVGPLIRLWRRARRQHQLPDAERLARARDLVGHRLVQLNAEHRTVQLLKPGMQLDLGGIAKGFAADAAASVLKRRGVTRSLVAASGDIVVAAPPPGESGWTIGIAAIDGADKPPSDYLLLRDAAVSTSGDTEQFVEISGRRYSHIVDPKTGVGLTDRMQVTVVAPNGIISDSLATAVRVLGPTRGRQLVDATDCVAALIVCDVDGRRVISESNGFKDIRRTKAKASQD
jgi:thiamine biosynthesis lipoprotein